MLLTIYKELPQSLVVSSYVFIFSGAFVLKNGEREEEFRIKLATSEDQVVTDIFVEGDIEEIERMQRELGLVQKGKVRMTLGDPHEVSRRLL